MVDSIAPATYHYGYPSQTEFNFTAVELDAVSLSSGDYLELEVPRVEVKPNLDLILHKLETLVAFIPAQKVDFNFGFSDFDATYQLEVELPSDDFIFYHDLNKTSVDYGKLRIFIRFLKIILVLIFYFKLQNLLLKHFQMSLTA